MGKDVIIALDFDSREKTLAFLDLFQDEKPFVKIGMELFYAEGPDIVRQIRARGHRIFLDLKLHDIPNTVRKAMKNLARLGADVKLLSCVGDDTFGTFIRRSCEDAGIDASHLYEAKGANSSMYLSILDADGDMLVGMSDMRIVQQDMPEDYLPSQKALIQGAGVVTCDPCMGEKMLLQLLDLCTPEQIVCVDPVSCAYARVVAPFIGRFHTAKPNRMELGILAGMEIQSDSDLERAGEAVLNKGLKRLFVSLGAEGCLYMDAAGTVLRRKLRPAKMVNASGAGDSFAAAMLYATLHGFDVKKTLDYAMAAGIAAVSHERTINPNMSTALLEEILLAHRI